MSVTISAARKATENAKNFKSSKACWTLGWPKASLMPCSPESWIKETCISWNELINTNKKKWIYERVEGLWFIISKNVTYISTENQLDLFHSNWADGVSSGTKFESSVLESNLTRHPDKFIGFLRWLNHLWCRAWMSSEKLTFSKWKQTFYSQVHSLFFPHLRKT